MNIEKTESPAGAGVVNTTPRKRILWTGVSICAPRNSVTEIQDNIIDHVGERLLKGTLGKKIVKSTFDLSPESVRIWWNLGIPQRNRLALLTPGLHRSEDKMTVGTWAMGGKLALHALGDGIVIRTCCPDDKTATTYEYPQMWLRDSSGNYNEMNETDWNVLRSEEAIKEDNDFTEILVKNPVARIKERFNPADKDTYKDELEQLLDYVGETYGLTFKKYSDVEFEMQINGKDVKPITYSSGKDIRNNLSRVPGFEPTWHDYDLRGLKIHVLVGCTNSMDVDDGGMYFYGNHGRLFARRERPFEYLNDIDVTHPQRKNWQMHIFFEGDTDLIPWNSPLKEGVNYTHPTMQMLRPILNELPLPYIQVRVALHAAEIRAYGEDYISMTDEKKKKLLFGKEMESDQEMLWKQLPAIVRSGRAYAHEQIERYDHGDLNKAIKSRMNLDTPKWSVTKARKWFRSNGITQKTTDDSQGKLNAFWNLNTFIDPVEVRPVINPEGSMSQAATGAPQTDGEEDSEDGGSAPQPMPEDEDEQDENVVLSSRISSRDKRRLAIAAHSDKPTEIVDFLIRLFKNAVSLTSSPELPEEVRSVDGMEERLKALTRHFGGAAE